MIFAQKKILIALMVYVLSLFFTTSVFSKSDPYVGVWSYKDERRYVFGKNEGQLIPGDFKKHLTIKHIKDNRYSLVLSYSENGKNKNPSKPVEIAVVDDVFTNVGGLGVKIIYKNNTLTLMHKVYTK